MSFQFADMVLLKDKREAIYLGVSSTDPGWSRVAVLEPPTLILDAVRTFELTLSIHQYPQHRAERVVEMKKVLVATAKKLSQQGE